MKLSNNSDVFLQRWDAARRRMADANIGALLMTPSTDLYYLTGFRGHRSERLTCFGLTKDGAFLFYPVFEKNYLNDLLLQGAELVPVIDGKDPFPDLVSRLKDVAGAIAVNDRMAGVTLLTLQRHLRGVEWRAASEFIVPMRILKDDEEYRLLKEAQGLAVDALQALLKGGLEGKKEQEAAAKLTALCAERGLAKASWGPTVASGENGGSPHHATGDRVIKRGDPVVIDFGGVYQGYQADITRTVVAGKASAEFRDVYAVVLAANEAAFKAAKVGALCEDVDRAARKVIVDAGYGDYFTHRLGHGIGLDAHEEPYMVAGNKRPIEEGMSFSDEPGIYLPGKFGIRIEDILFARDTGTERLTDFTHEIQEVP